MVDPVDGTTNFVHRFPFVCVAIGLAIKQQVAFAIPNLTLCSAIPCYEIKFHILPQCF